MPETVVLSLGSNIEPGAYLVRAMRALSERWSVEAVSVVYENPAVGPGGQPNFLNAAVRLRVDEGVDPLRRELRAIEHSLGRDRSGDRFAPRTIDLDLLLHGKTLLEEDVDRFAHLAVPAAEVAPDWVHPRTGETVRCFADRLRGQGALKPRPDVDLRGLLPDVGVQ